MAHPGLVFFSSAALLYTTLALQCLTIAIGAEYVNWLSPGRAAPSCAEGEVGVGESCFQDPRLRTSPAGPSCLSKTTSEYATTESPTVTSCNFAQVPFVCTDGHTPLSAYGSSIVEWGERAYLFGGCSSTTGAATGQVRVLINNTWVIPPSQGTRIPDDICGSAVSRLGNSSLIAVYSGANPAAGGEHSSRVCF